MVDFQKDVLQSNLETYVDVRISYLPPCYNFRDRKVKNGQICAKDVLDKKAPAASTSAASTPAAGAPAASTPALTASPFRFL